jgi:hypothetical protein
VFVVVQPVVVRIVPILPRPQLKMKLPPHTLDETAWDWGQANEQHQARYMWELQEGLQFVWFAAKDLAQTLVVCVEHGCACERQN